MSALPLSLLDAHVWPRLHELAYYPSMQRIRLSGVSFFEDLPDLLWSGPLVRAVDDAPASTTPGWSQRVTEFHNQLKEKSWRRVD